MLAQLEFFLKNLSAIQSFKCKFCKIICKTQQLKIFIEQSDIEIKPDHQEN